MKGAADLPLDQLGLIALAAFCAAGVALLAAAFAPGVVKVINRLRGRR